MALDLDIDKAIRLNGNKLEKRYPGGSFDVEKSEHRRVGDR